MNISIPRGSENVKAIRRPGLTILTWYSKSRHGLFTASNRPSTGADYKPSGNQLLRRTRHFLPQRNDLCQV
jgi:hypothetical protein